MVAPVPDVVAPVPDVVAPVPDVVAPVPDVVAPVADVVAPVVDVVAPVVDVVAPVVDVVAPVVDVVAPVVDVVAPVVDVVAPVVDVVAPVVDVVAPVVDVVAPVLDVVGRRFVDVVAPGLSFGFLGCWPGALAPVPDVVAPGSSFGFFAPVECWSAGAVIAVRGGTAGTGIGNGDRAPGTHQQARCEHANTCSEAQTQQTHHHLLPPANGPIASGPPFATLSHSKTIGDTGIASQIRAAGRSNIPTTRSRANHWRMTGTLK